MLIPLIALTIMPMDTPIEPIDSTVVLMMADTMSTTICEPYLTMEAAASVIDTTGIFMEAADAYFITSFEEGWDPEGNARLTSEARDLMLTLLHAC